ncbi:hypothetical protein [Serratia symbiotica]|uniref:hypothetical protein n=1 Tax=Serratia symbiotica TaxID=138074 RepID=UPI003B00A303
MRSTRWLARPSAGVSTRGSDKIYTADELRQRIIDLRNELRGSQGSLDVPVQGDLSLPWVTAALDLSTLLVPQALSKQFRLRPLTWGMTRAQLVATGIALILALAGLMVYLHAVGEREAAARLAIERARIRQAELNRQARYQTALAGLRHPWIDKPSVSTFIRHCREGWIVFLSRSRAGYLPRWCVQTPISAFSLCAEHTRR